MNIRPEEIVEILTNRIKQYEQKVEIEDLGTVIQVGDNIARIYGLMNAKSGELLAFGNDTFGIALNLEENNIGCIILGSDTNIQEGDKVRTTGRVVGVPVGEQLLGRVVNPLGQPIDGLGEIKTKKWRPIERGAPGVIDRQPVKQPLQTGLKAIDSMIPIGRGQRELIIGDRKTGKTAIALDTIINQLGKNVICIYVAIGKKDSTVAHVVKLLRDYNAMAYSIVVSATASDTATLQYIAPYAACSMAEDFMDNGNDVLIVYDDLSNHAKAYRQISLLLRRPPGREAYPGDIFYIHSRLLERSVKYSDDKGGGSMTALPIVETQAGDISAYIPTNIISITDGQIYLRSELFNAGVRPAIDVGLSVSRVGGSAQIKAMKEVSGALRLDMAQYRDIESFAQFGTELDKTSQAQLEKGKRLVEVLKQDQYQPLDISRQVISLYAVVNNFLNDIPVEKIRKFESGLLEFIENEHPDFLEEIDNKNALDDQLRNNINSAIEAFKQYYKAGI
ncbi:MAG: F0F1 ATP synthase subunit alpha [Candidatus Margulisiibacteriota bacterium]|nr:MAG: F0F1 ATP synthase subunit alpha [Candidatus Margulisbacteria bacterium GWD2_39_127]PZM77449.1 MAG: F0F1 ATP synthase subunit alpha [Candidatus Margulisiibacteriota bacterium]HAR63988.1 F0F1 ATP synthase subunit alpha [Candidatus Margulisiibacteriota bacterium]HCY37886.1 F0F1 ATP synthase subunit alpha [Candidatus Margulisiibacteriota bacterium]